MSLESSTDVLPISETEIDESHVEKALKPVENRSIKFDFHLPEEVWELILNNLTEADDRTNCCRAFPLFDRILTKSKPVWMFKQILPLMPRSWADKQSVLTCRRICQQWCVDIDRGILTNPAFWYVTCGRPVNMKNWYLFDSEEKLDSFTQTFEGHSGNPFLTKTVGIKNYLQNPNYEIPLKALALFSNYGKHISTLNFHWEYPVVEILQGIHQLFDWVDLYEFFQRVLTNTPNLKKLIMRGNMDTIVLYSNDGRDEHSFLLSLRENPLPLIPTLDTLEIRNSLGANFFPDSFIKMLILTYATNLQEITVEDLILGQMLQDQVQLPKLAYLQVEKVSGDQHLKKMLMLTAPLKKLEIWGPIIPRPGSPINLAILLEVFQRFELLEEVEIVRCFVETQVDVDVTHLINSSVRKLTLRKIGGNGASTCFNFLQNFKKLEELTVCLESPRGTYLGREEGEGGVQFYKMLETDQRYESNIWRIIPSLKTVDIHCEHKLRGRVRGNRKEFEKYQARRLQNKD